MSSMRRARSSASASAEAGLLATSAASPFLSGAIPLAHWRTSCASNKRRSSPPSACGSSSASVAIAPVAACAKMISSSSTSPTATMRGRMAAPSPSHVEEEVARQPAGAARRQIERRTRQRERVARCRKARHQLSVDQRPDERRHERRRSRNGEDAGESHGELYTAANAAGADRQTPGNYAALARIAASAAMTASGVPTCIHTPSSRSPNKRPASAARSNSGDMEEGPSGTPAKNAGARIAAPA